jgi:adenosylcobinamide kinase/adenosylcobinamide-phosphate guanylyltransferase
MQDRIDRHRRDRPASWTTIEEPEDVASAVVYARPAGAPVVVDCVTVWISNLLWKHRDVTAAQQERAVLRAAQELADAGRRRSVIAVSNDVGGGTVPDHPVARTFRDVHGLANQLLAREAGRVVLVVAGLPIVLKARQS